MVARPNDTPARKRATVATVAGELFGYWRVAVTKALRAARSLPSRSGATAWLASVADFIGRPEGMICSNDPRARVLVSRTGYGLLAIGTSLAAFVTWHSGAGAVAAVADGARLIVWAGARLAVMRLAATGELRTRPAAVGVAWSGGLMPLALAATPYLHAVALVASAALTWRALRAGGGTKREVWSMVGAAFGGQAAVEVVAWMVRGGIIYALVLGR